MVFSDFLEFRRLLIIIYCITKREPSPKSCVSHHVHNISRISSQPPVMWLYPTLERPRTQRYYLSLLVFSSCRLKHCSTDWLTPPNKFKKVVNQMYLPCNTFKINTACIYGLGQCKDILSQFRMLKDLRGQVQTLPKESINPILKENTTNTALATINKSHYLKSVQTHCRKGREALKSKWK